MLQLGHGELAPKAVHEVEAEVKVKVVDLTCVEECFEVKRPKFTEEDEAIVSELHEELAAVCRG